MLEKPKFSLGRTVATPAAIQFIQEHGVDHNRIMTRHHFGDWGDVCEEDRRQNEWALKHGERLMSVYNFDAGAVWIITERDRSATTILLPEDY